MKPSTSRVLLVSLVTLALGGAAPAFAQSVTSTGGLVGQNPGQSAKELRARGYVRQSRDTRAGVTHEYWWSASRERCLQVTIERGVVSQVGGLTPYACGHTTTTAGRTPKYDDYASSKGYRSTSRQREIEREREAREERRFDVDDVVGDRASSANAELRDEGFRHLYSGKVKGEPVRTYWNPDTRECIDVVLSDSEGGNVVAVKHLSDDACI